MVVISNPSVLFALCALPPLYLDAMQSYQTIFLPMFLGAAMQEIHITLTEPQLILIISLPLTVVFQAIATSKSVRETIRSLHDPTLSPNIPKLLLSMFLAIGVSSILVLSVDLAYLIERDVCHR
jgi:xanthine/uracil/vitamin C permease (AzgA family)